MLWASLPGSRLPGGEVVACGRDDEGVGLVGIVAVVVDGETIDVRLPGPRLCRPGTTPGVSSAVWKTLFTT